MVRLEKIKISGTEFEINPPVVIGDNETLSITGDGKLLWAATGIQLAKFDQDAKCRFCKEHHAPRELCKD